MAETEVGTRLSRSAVLPVLALGSSAFVFVTAETIPIGLLPQMSRGLGVSEGNVGLLLTLYAALAGLTAIPLTAMTTQFPRRRLVAVTVAVLAVTQFGAAVAPSFALVALARLVCACAHGVFWSVLAPVASRLAPPGQAGRVTSLVFVGNSAALVLGVPLGTALGQVAGWRFTMAAIGVAAALSTVALALLLPALLVDTEPASLRGRLRAGPELSGPLALICGVTALVVIGHFAAYTYVAPLVLRDAGLAGAGLSALLLGYGLTGLVGNVLAGRGIDRRPRRTLAISVLCVALSLTVLAVARGSVWVTVLAVLVWGAAFTSIPASLQAAVLRAAPDNADNASASYVVAFQIGIGGGALVGGRLVDAHLVGSLPVLGAAGAMLSLGLIVGTRAFR